MDALKLQVSIPAQASAKAGAQDASLDEAAGAGEIAAADLFPALLAQQMGAVMLELPNGKAVKADGPGDADGVDDHKVGAEGADLLLALQQAAPSSPVLAAPAGVLPVQAAAVTSPVETLPVQAAAVTAPVEKLPVQAAAVVAPAGVLPDEAALAGVRPFADPGQLPKTSQPGPVVSENTPVQRQAVAVGAATFAIDAKAPPVESGPGVQAFIPFSFPAQSSGVVPAAAQPAAAIPQAVGSPAWGGAVGDRVVWMVGQEIKSAEIRLNPPSLGPLEVRLSMSDGQASLTFTTQHVPVREALEAATPRLREMLGESGIGLGSVSVNVGSFSQQNPGTPQDNGRSGTAWAGSEEAVSDFASLLPVSTSRVGNGMVDLFA